MMLKNLIQVFISNFIEAFLVYKKWETDNFIPYEIGGVTIEAPKRRMHHAADVFGCMLVI